VPERTIGIKPSLIQRAVEQMIDPQDPEFMQYGRALSRFLIHPDFKGIIEDESTHLVTEVDRQMARVPWEMLHRGPGTEPLSIRRPVARQLRTTYSPRPPELSARGRLRALVIGDPADPPHSLNGSRLEAEEVAKLLESHGVEVEVRIGAPEDGTGVGPLHDKGIRPAELLEIVDLLSNGEFDLLHYSGHADFDDQNPDLTGWLFKGGEFLTPGELEAVERPPSIVVANACLSGLLARGEEDLPTQGAAAVGVVPKRSRGRDAALVPGLADAFFRRGVYDYIGTAWQVKEEPAITFARAFYEALLGTGDRKGISSTVGEAVQAARRALYKERLRFGNVWGAYQHYGDPTRQLNIRGRV
jgi:hypothetical protein